jgi:hypothetical protein
MYITGEQNREAYRSPRGHDRGSRRPGYVAEARGHIKAMRTERQTLFSCTLHAIYCTNTRGLTCESEVPVRQMLLNLLNVLSELLELKVLVVPGYGCRAFCGVFYFL